MCLCWRYESITIAEPTSAYLFRLPSDGKTTLFHFTQLESLKGSGNCHEEGDGNIYFRKMVDMHINIETTISADPSPFSRGRRKEWRRRRVGLLVVDVLLIPCALSWRRSGVWLCRIHCQEAAALGLFGVGCVTFSVYVGGLVSSLLGFPKLHFGTLRRTDFGTLRRMVFCFVWGRI